MDIQYARLGDASFEADHWWIRSRFCLLDRSLQKRLPDSPLSVLEIGCGTALNLHYLQDHHRNRLTRLMGVDPYAREESQGLISLRKEIPADELFDWILAMDVLEHTKHPVDLLRLAGSRLKPDGLLLVTVPAFQWLWTAYDEIAGHERRYSQNDLREQVMRAGFEIQDLFFLFSATFPLLLMQRIWMKFFSSNPRLFKPVHPWVNAFLLALTFIEIHSWMPYNHWFGSSLVVFARKKAA